MTTFAAVFRTHDSDFGYRIYAGVGVQVLTVNANRRARLRVSVRRGSPPEDLAALVRFSLATPQHAPVMSHSFYVLDGECVVVPSKLALHRYSSDAREVIAGEELCDELTRWVEQDAASATCDGEIAPNMWDAVLAEVRVENVALHPAGSPLRPSRSNLELHQLIQWLLHGGPRWREVEASP